MKKVFAVIVALILAVSLCVPASAAGRGTTSGQMTPFFVDYDPQALSDLLGGFDISGIFNDLGFGDLGGMLGGFDLGSLFGDFDLGGMLGDFDIGSLLGDFDIIGMIMDLFGGGGGGGSGDGTTTTTTTTTAPTTGTTPPTTGTVTPPSQTGDTSGVSMAVAVGVMAIAAVAFVCTRKKKED